MKTAGFLNGKNKSPHVIVCTLLILALSSSLILNSCSRKPEVKETGSKGMEEHAMLAGWKFRWPQGNADEGRKLFVELECYKCHEIKGESFPKVSEKEQGVGPELSQMAGLHPVEFFAESIINPNVFLDKEDKVRGYLGADGKSKMPDYNDALTIKQVSDLAAYLSSLKEQKHGGH